MSHGLLWLPLLLAFVLLAALGWLERRRQNLFRSWAEVRNWPSLMAVVGRVSRTDN